MCAGDDERGRFAPGEAETLRVDAALANEARPAIDDDVDGFLLSETGVHGIYPCVRCRDLLGVGTPPVDWAGAFEVST